MLIVTGEVLPELTIFTLTAFGLNLFTYDGSVLNEHDSLKLASTHNMIAPLYVSEPSFDHK
jgi:hypothetical protein